MEGWYYSLLWRFFLNNFSPHDIFKDIYRYINSTKYYTFIFWYYLGIFFFFFSFFFIDLKFRLLSNYLKEEFFVGRFFSFKKGINLPVSFDFTLFNCPIFFRILPARFSNDLTRGFQWNTLFIGWNNRWFLRENRERICVMNN